MVEEECLFCKIVEGKIPCFKVYEDENFIGFLDIFPVCEGHVLLIPKQPFRWVWDLPDELYAKYWLVAKKLAVFLQERLKSDFIISHIEGTDVPHAHIHLEPQLFGKIRNSRMFFASDEERINFVKRAHEKIGFLKD